MQTLTHGLSHFLFGCAALGLVALSLQLWFVARHRERKPSVRRETPESISILKPLCGRDDALDQSLLSFATLDHPSYELVLGVKDRSDPAFPAALAIQRRFPSRVRVVVQRGEPGFNPKVNQLISMERAASHDILVISDSNARVERGYLREIASAFEELEVGCVTHPVIGAGEQRFGSLLDNLHLSTAIGPGMISAKRAVDRDVVVGKSMALRKGDLAALGGFARVKDILAEDYVIGRAVREELGKRVVVATSPVINYSRDRSMGDFVRRYFRWSVIHRTVLRPSTYLAQVLLNPIPLAILATLLRPQSGTVLACAAVMYMKAAVDLSTAHLMGYRVHLSSLPAVIVKDLLLFAAWVRGLVCRTVDWRGNLLRVTHGSRLVAQENPMVPISAGRRLRLFALRRG